MSFLDREVPLCQDFEAAVSISFPWGSVGTPEFWVLPQRIWLSRSWVWNLSAFLRSVPTWFIHSINIYCTLTSCQALSSEPELSLTTEQTRLLSAWSLLPKGGRTGWQSSLWSCIFPQRPLFLFWLFLPNLQFSNFSTITLKLASV